MLLFYMLKVYFNSCVYFRNAPILWHSRP